MGQVTFLGTGGGRFVFLTQKRHTGGIWLELGGARLLVDPGPGALVRALDAGLDPGTLDCVISSHGHLDHYNDVEVMVEAMTHGLNRRQGLLVLQEDVVPYVSEYHRASVETLVARSGESFTVRGLRVDVLSTCNHAGGLGFRFEAPEGRVTYSGDTAYAPDVVAQYLGSRMLILNTIFPKRRASDTHLNTDDAERIASETRPKHLILTHFGVRMLAEDPAREAERIQRETGVRTTAATDGMTVRIGDGGPA